MRSRPVILFTIATLFFGCPKKSEQTEIAPIDPITLSATQVRAELKSAAQPLWTQLQQGGITTAQLETVPELLKKVNQKYQDNENQEDALHLFEDDLIKLVNSAKQKEDWRLIKHACYAWNATFPKRRRYERLLSEAELVTARPIVTFQGAIEPLGEGDEMSVNLKVEDPKTKKAYNYWVKEGQTFHYQLLKLERIKIEDVGLEMEYLPIHQLWVVPT
jgi:hypothetical protein